MISQPKRLPVVSATMAALVTVLTVLTGCGGERGPTDSGATNGRLSIATGNTTGVYYQLGGGYARLVGRYVPGWTATAEATGASVENIRRVVAGDSDIAFTLADTAADAATGRGTFDEPQPIRALARIYTNYTQVLARSDAGIRTLADLKGKRVSTGSPNSGTEVIALRLLVAAGLDPEKDVTRQKLSLPETVQAMKDGTVDAMFWSGGLPTSGVTDLTTSLRRGVAFLDLDAELPKLQAEFGSVYQASTIEPAVYGTQKKVSTIGVPNLLVVKDTMDAGLAEKLTALLFEHQADLVKVHPEAGNIKRETATKTAPVQLHPGAQKYYDTH
jgi:TRAP transporter TAXI family solute receptor